MPNKSLEDVILRVQTYASKFGRLRDDILMICDRGRSGDYKGVLQNARLVLEGLLRNLAVTELDMPIRNKTINELLAQFQQGANAAIVPPKTLLHMRNVQNLGNLGAHDHADRLSVPGVAVDPGDALAGLISLAEILAWHVERYPSTDSLISLSGESSSPTPPQTPQASHPAPRRSRLPLLFVIGSVGVAALAVVYFVSREYAKAPKTAAVARQQDRKPITAAPISIAREDFRQALAEAREVEAPKQCQSDDPKLLELLASTVRSSRKVGDGAKAGGEDLILEMEREKKQYGRTAEYWFVLGKLQLFVKQDANEAARSAKQALLICEDYAAAANLAGATAFRMGDTVAASNYYETSSRLSPDYAAPRINLSLLQVVKGGPMEPPIEALSAILNADPSSSRARMVRGMAYYKAQKNALAIEDLEVAVRLEPNNAAMHALLADSYAADGRADEAGRAYCTSLALGNSDAKPLCTEQ